MSQCVPSLDLEENSEVELHSPDSNSSSSLLADINKHSMDYDVAELTCENGQLAMHGLRNPHTNMSRTDGTLESIVNQATCHLAVDDGRDISNGTLESIVNLATCHLAVDDGGDITNAVWVNPAGATIPAITMDVFVPCEPSMDGGVGVGINSFKTNGSMTEAVTCGEIDTHQLMLDTWERELPGPSEQNTIPATIPFQDYSKTSADYHFISHSNSQRKTGDEEGKTKLSIGKSAGAIKKSRAAAIHNQSERKRRDKINQRMRTLQKLIPNSSKKDKASMLDEVIEYLKQLQGEVHMMNMRMNMPSMTLPLATQQQLQMSMMGMGMGMGMGVMDTNAINRATAIMPPVIPPAAAFMPTPWDNTVDCLSSFSAGSVMPDPLAALLARQYQPMTIDAYSRLAAIYQQYMQQPPT